MNMNKQTAIDQLKEYPYIQLIVATHWGTEMLALYLSKLLIGADKPPNSYEIREVFSIPVFDALVNTFNDLVKHSQIPINQYDEIR